MSLHGKNNELKGKRERLNYPFSQKREITIVLHRDMQWQVSKMGADISAEVPVIWMMVVRQ